MIKKEDITKEEMEKCINSPVYFYNNYVRKSNEKILNEEEFECLVKQIEYERNNIPKAKLNYINAPYTIEECYKKLPNFIKK